jgi:putative aldouronate transport system substrate-binding protein
MRKHVLWFPVILLGLSLTACQTAATPTATSQPAATKAATQAPADEAPAPDPFGKYDTTVVLTPVRSFETNEKLPEGDTPENNQYTRAVKDILNIDVQYLWTAAPADYDQKVNLTIASNDLPDGRVPRAGAT